MKYQLLYRFYTGNSGLELAEENFTKVVNKWIQKGYKPLGGISVNSGETEWIEFAQAMIKED